MADTASSGNTRLLPGPEDEGWAKASKYCEEATRSATLDPKKYGHMNPDDIKKRAEEVWPSIQQGIPDAVGYYWLMDLTLDDSKPTLVFVNDGKVWMFGGSRIPTPRADKLWFQGGIVPPFPTRDYLRDGRYFTQAIPGESGRWEELPQAVEHS
jgi:hypothetical protein